MTQATKTVIAGCAMLGGIAGIMIAFGRSAKFAGGLGLFIIGTVAGGAAGYGISSAIPDSKEDKNDTE